MKNLLIGFFLSVFSINAASASKEEGKMENDAWDDFFLETAKIDSPFKTARLAHEYFASEGRGAGRAVDLGAGTGRDALFLLRQGWSVLAIDKEALPLEILSKKAEKYENRLEIQKANFSEMVLPDEIDLVNASFSLPFNRPEDFDDCWEKIVKHLSLGGRFSGHFFGLEDSWTKDNPMTFLSKDEVFSYFSESFEVEYFNEMEWDGDSGSGPKHWHIYEVVARKIK